MEYDKDFELEREKSREQSIYLRTEILHSESPALHGRDEPPQQPPLARISLSPVFNEQRVLGASTLRTVATSRFSEYKPRREVEVSAEAVPRPAANRTRVHEKSLPDTPLSNSVLSGLDPVIERANSVDIIAKKP